MLSLLTTITVCVKNLILVISMRLSHLVIRFALCMLSTPNKYGIGSMGFKYEWPEEFNEHFKIDYEKMFDKILFQSISRFYDSVGWAIRKPTENVKTELFDLFG